MSRSLFMIILFVGKHFHAKVQFASTLKGLCGVQKRAVSHGSFGM